MLNDTTASAGVGVILVSAVGTVWRSSGVPILIAGWIRENVLDKNGKKTNDTVEKHIFAVRWDDPTSTPEGPDGLPATARVVLRGSSGDGSGGGGGDWAAVMPRGRRSTMCAERRNRNALSTSEGVRHVEGSIPGDDSGGNEVVVEKEEEEEAEEEWVTSVKEAIAEANGLESGARAVRQLAQVEPSLRFLRPLRTRADVKTLPNNAWVRVCSYILMEIWSFGPVPSHPVSSRIKNNKYY